MRLFSLNGAIPCAALLLAVSIGRAGDDKSGANVYVQTNLVSDQAGVAARVDLQLVNAWGIDHSGTGPWWVNSNEKGVSIVYDGNGAAFPAATPIVVTIPTPSGTGTSAPTGIVFNGTSDFSVSGMPAFFLFATEDGTIAAWNQNTGMQAVIKATISGAEYKGLTIGQMGGHNVIYAANFTGKSVDVFDTTFTPVTLPSSAFHDSNIPSDFSPFNVQNINGSIIVTFAKLNAATGDDVSGPGNGYVDRFSGDGTLLTRFEHGSFLNSPWGVTLSPTGFGKLSEKLLVGQFGSGQIAAYELDSGKFQDLMNGTNGQPIVIDGLWGLKFGNGALAGPTNLLYFAAGPGGEMHGLFGTLSPAAFGK